MRNVNLQNYLLLGKQTILIARFSEEEVRLAKNQYGAQVKETPETQHLLQLCFTQPSIFFKQ